MSVNSKYLVYLVLILATLSRPSIALMPPQEVSDAVVLQWGFVYMPPLVYMDEQGKVQGELTTLMAEVSDLSGVIFEPIEFPNARAIFTINQQKINFAVGMKSIITQPENFIFSQDAVAKLHLQALFKEQTEKINSIDELSGKRLILLAGYTYGGLRTKLEQMASHYVDVETHSRAIAALNLGRGEYALTYKMSSDFVLAKQQQQGFKAESLFEIDLFFILSDTVPNAEEVMQQLETALATSDKIRPN